MPNQEKKTNGAPPSLVPEGTVTDSLRYPKARSVVKQDIPDYSKSEVVGEQVSREWEYVTVARPVEIHENIIQVPTERVNQTFVPNVQVREVIKEIPKESYVYDEKIINIPHKKIVDKYVEVPIISGTETKYVPKIDVQERVVKMTKPEIKWVEKVIEIPQIKEVVRYVESDRNVETIIRYVPKGSPEQFTLVTQQPSSLPDRSNEENKIKYVDIEGPKPGTYPPSGYVSLAPTQSQQYKQPYFPPTESKARTPRLDLIEQLFIPRVEKTVEIEKQIPVTVDVAVPFMVPKPVQVPVDVPVIKFRDHFVPVPIRRHVIPKITFTDEVYEVECTIEKPFLVVNDTYQPVPVNAQIRLKEKDIKVVPMDPAELSQADFHAMWMRVNADLLEQWKEEGHCVRTSPYADHADEEDEKDEVDTLDEDLTEEEKAEKLKQRREAKEARRKNKYKDDMANAEQITDDSSESIKDPSGPIDFGPLPLHPGHPLMMTFLQNQWIQNPSTITHNLYTPEFFRLHASSLDGLLHPQPHQINISQEQSAQLGPLPADILSNPWIALDMNQGPANASPDTDNVHQQPRTERFQNDHIPGPTFYSAAPLSTHCSPCSQLCCPHNDSLSAESN